MATLKDVLTSDDRKTQVVSDCMELIDLEVKDRSGVSGMAIKAGYKAVKGIRPGFIEKVVSDLLPEFADAVDPIYKEAVEADTPVRGHFEQESSRVADALLSITDGRAERSKNGLVKKTYERLRGSAKKNVEQAVPRLGQLVDKHTG